MRVRLLLAAALVCTAAPLPAQSPLALVQRAAAAMGGEQALRMLAGTTLEVNAATFGIGQEETPSSPARATFVTGRIITDYRAARRLSTQEIRPITGLNVRQRRVIADGIGMTEANGAQTPDAPAAVAAAAAEIRLLPDQLVRTALENPTKLSAVAPRRWRGELMDGVRYAGADTVVLWFDRLSALLVVTERVTDDPILGDRRTATLYTRWQSAGNVKLPREIDVEVNGRLQQHQVVTAAMVAGPFADSLFVIPDSIMRRAQRGWAPPPPIVVNLVQLAPGVWRAEGGTHFSLVVEQPNGLTVVEAPQTSARSKAVLDTLKSRFPGKRVRTVVSTHHHWDHSGGVREYIAQGIEVVTHRRNADFVRALAAAKKTVAPDGLSRTPRVPVIRQMTDTLSLGTGNSRVQLFALPTAHVEGIVAAYLPAHRLLFVADVVTPGPTLPPAGCREVVEMVRARGITVDRLVGAHGGIANWADVQSAAAR